MGRKVRAYFVRLYWGLKDTRHIKHLKEHLIHREYQYRITFTFIREVEGAGGATVKPRFFWFSNCRGAAATFRACDNGGGTDLPWISCSSTGRAKLLWRISYTGLWGVGRFLHSRTSAELTPIPCGKAECEHSARSEGGGPESETSWRSLGNLLSPRNAQEVGEGTWEHFKKQVHKELHAA